MKGRKLKLSSLKEWLTLEEASKQMSLLFNEHVEPKDIIKLAIEGQFRLSVYLRRCFFGRNWVIKEVDDDQFLPIIEDSAIKQITGFDVCTGNPLRPESNLIQFEDLVPVSGLWDLPMIGTEKTEAEKAFFSIIGEPIYTTPSYVGFFVYSTDSGFVELIETTSEENDSAKEYALKTGHKRKVLPGISGGFVHIDNDYERFFTGLGVMPENSIFVVRPESINDFVNKLKSKEVEVLSEDKEQTYLSIIAALLNLLVKEPKGNRTQESVAIELQGKYMQFAKSFSASSLTKLFPKAKAALMNKVKEK